MTFHYPLQPGDSFAPRWQARILNRAKALIDPLRPAANSADVKLDLVQPASQRPLGEDDIAVVFLCHNDMRFLRSFYAHYRAMGVTRFICVDDASSDGTRAFLEAQPDTDLHVSNVRYRDAARGKIWRELLLSRYGRDRWYLVVDSDEYFLYETFPREPVLDYARRLQRTGCRRLAAPMLDLYPVGDLSGAGLAGDDETMPWDVATHFDGDGYKANIFDTGLSIYGGVRARLFGANGELMKYPLLFWDRASSMGRSIHRPRPAAYNFTPAMGALLHFKIFSDVREQAEIAVSEGQHYGGAELYRRLLNRLDDAVGQDGVAYGGTLAYRGVDDLLARGFMKAVE